MACFSSVDFSPCLLLYQNKNWRILYSHLFEFQNFNVNILSSAHPSIATLVEKLLHITSVSSPCCSALTSLFKQYNKDFWLCIPLPICLFLCQQCLVGCITVLFFYVLFPGGDGCNRTAPISHDPKFLIQSYLSQYQSTLCGGLPLALMPLTSLPYRVLASSPRFIPSVCIKIISGRFVLLW